MKERGGPAGVIQNGYIVAQWGKRRTKKRTKTPTTFFVT
jgi:hypothetical protein